MGLEIKERSTESIEDIWAFYSRVGYSGGITLLDKIFVALHDHELIGVVRIAFEEGYPILRGMQILPAYQRKRIGISMLKHLEPYLDSLQQTCYSIPYDHLLPFYGRIGFSVANAEEVPAFLQTRHKDYENRGLKVAPMKRSL
jgi:GNAT superfamily N-acetyltransferase